MKNFLTVLLVLATAFFVLFAALQYIHRVNDDRMRRLCVTYSGTVVDDSDGSYLNCTITKPQP